VREAARSTWSAPVSGLAGVPVITIQGRVDCHVVPRYSSDPVLAFESWVLPSITGDLPRQSLEPSVRDKFSHLALADNLTRIEQKSDRFFNGLEALTGNVIVAVEFLFNGSH